MYFILELDQQDTYFSNSYIYVYVTLTFTLMRERVSLFQFILELDSNMHLNMLRVWESDCMIST